jgi:hypothetical protein
MITAKDAQEFLKNSIPKVETQRDDWLMVFYN